MQQQPKSQRSNELKFKLYINVLWRKKKRWCMQDLYQVFNLQHHSFICRKAQELGNVSNNIIFQIILHSKIGDEFANQDKAFTLCQACVRSKQATEWLLKQSPMIGWVPTNEADLATQIRSFLIIWEIQLWSGSKTGLSFPSYY